MKKLMPLAVTFSPAAWMSIRISILMSASRAVVMIFLPVPAQLRVAVQQTIIDHMGFGPNGCRLRHQLEVYRGYAAHKAVIDYSFHGVIQHINHAIPRRNPDDGRGRTEQF